MAMKLFPQVAYNGTSMMPVSVSYFDTDSGRQNTVVVDCTINENGSVTAIRNSVEQQIVVAVNNDNNTPGKAAVGDIWW